LERREIVKEPIIGFRPCRIAATTLLLALSTGVLAADADRWWSHVLFLADDRLEGRETGSEGHRHAARYVAEQFERAGLTPGGSTGYLQPVHLRSRRIVERASSLALVRGDRIEPVALGREAAFDMQIDAPPVITAPIVFVGYGLTVPELDYDDLAGLDVQGRVALLLTGGPPHVPDELIAHHESTRWNRLEAAGAVGTISILNPKQMDMPWERSMFARLLPYVAFADPALEEAAGQQLAVTVNPARAEKFFDGSDHSLEEILALAGQGRPLPRFPLPISVRARVTMEIEEVESMNVVGLLPGTDAALRDEYVVLTAHLDHVGVGTAVNGDRTYNGAMDNAAGIGTLIETAAAIRDAGTQLRRSLVFLASTAEEHGLLGSRYYAERPTVGAPGGIVANLNTDMFLPLFPLRSVAVLGVQESDLADDVRRAAQSEGIGVMTDPEPERNSIVRSDHYSFIRRGVPSIAFKFGFERDSREHEIVKRWRAERYHAPSDDVSQPIDLRAAADFNRFYLRVVEAVANRPTRPQWNAGSFYRRFADPQQSYNRSR
jgi:hypothetical protein